jgi:Leucine-rich repeat (LRR) protein
VQTLDLSQNALTLFPTAVTSCLALEILKLSSNSVPLIPAELSNCVRLKELHLANNAVEAIPPALGSCTALELIDLNSNRLSEIPPELGSLMKLRRLLLNNNQQLAAMPGEVLTRCVLLHTLELHGTQVTREILQQTSGYEGFEKRRQSKFSKAIVGNAMMNESGVDEGVDVVLK